MAHVPLDTAFPEESVAWAMNERDLEHLLEAVSRADEVVLDLETTGLDDYATEGGERNGGVGARISLLALTLPTAGDGGVPVTWLLPLSHMDSPFLGRWREAMRRVAELIVEEQKPVIGQNIKFDSRWIWACTGVDISARIVWDTRVSSHLLDETSSSSLKDRASQTFTIDRWDDFSLKEPGASEKVPLMELGAYAARDTYWTWRLADLHRSIMHLDEEVDPDEDLDPDDIRDARLGKLAVWCAMPTVSTLTAVEQRGIRLDREWTQDRLTTAMRRVKEIEVELSGRYPGFEKGLSFAPTSYSFRDWTQAAVEAGDLEIVDLTPKGKPKWSKGVLVRLSRKGSPVAPLLLEARSNIKQGEYLGSWLWSADQNGDIHASYSAGTVATGRLSCSSPNMQQVTKQLRPAFVPRPGYVFMDSDYSQIELRMAAFIARCVPMIEAFRRGDDLHRTLASRITGRAMEDVLPLERQHAKAANFGLLYGMGAYGFRRYAEDAYDVSFTQSEANAIYHAFFDTWKGMAEWHARSGARVRDTGQASSPIGRVRRLPGVFSGNEGDESYAVRAAINAPVQGFASDVMQIAAALIEGRLPGSSPVEGARIVATVHDSVLIELPEDSWEEAAGECIRRMTQGVLPVLRRMDCDLDVPLAVEAAVGTRWGVADIATLS